MNDIHSIYSDAGLLSPNPSTIGSVWAGVFVGRFGNILMTKQGHFLSKGTPLPYHEAELYAVLQCLATVPKNWIGNFYCDNERAIGWLTKGYDTGAMLPEIFQEMLHIVRGMVNFGRINFILTKSNPSNSELYWGHTDDERKLHCSVFNRVADKICKEHANYVKLFEI